MKNKISLFTLLLSLLALSFSSCSNKDIDDAVETVISFKDLPVKAQTFINDYYSGIEIKKIEKELGAGLTFYEVDFASGDEVVFDAEGEWQEVDAPDGKTIPDGIVPQAIMEYLNQNYPDYGVNEINRTAEGYKVELVTHVNLYFNPLGQIIE